MWDDYDRDRPANDSGSTLRTTCSIRSPPRQRQVLRELKHGRTEADIARRLRIDYETVHSHVKAIYRHFRVHSKAKLLVKCFRAKAAAK